MPIYQIRLSRKRAERLHVRLKEIYRCNKKLLPLAIQAAQDYSCIRYELDQDSDESNTAPRSGLFRRFLSKDT